MFLTQCVFYIAVFMALFFYAKLNRQNISMVLLLFGWLFLQAILSNRGIYTRYTQYPTLLIAVFPALLFAIVALLKNKNIALNRNEWLLITLLHMVRIPVEWVLHQLYLLEEIPVTMTYEGRNFDILSGISAIILFIMIWNKSKFLRNTLIIWNIVALMLVLQVVTTGVLSAPGPQQIWSIDQPNMGVLKYPFIWLPSFIVPLVIWSHIKCLISLFKFKEETWLND